MSGHDPRLDGGRAALIAQLDEAIRGMDEVLVRAREIRAKNSELAVKLNDARAEIERLRGATRWYAAFFKWPAPG